MSKILALLSGKGGSGKTTLALSIASMLSNCGIKVLLIDCDLSTNGATYFYENRLADHNGNVKSFYNVILEESNINIDFSNNSFRGIKFGTVDLSNKNIEDNNLIKINNYMDFMPSITQITKENIGVYSFDENDLGKLNQFKARYKEKYEIVIFDCQAGYTDVLKLILPIVDINLFVMEADAISSSSIRSLYLKIGGFINDNKIFQVFNKATNEEYDIYSKISGGTVFTNIETVMFDWKIRKAFAVAEIPDMENTSANFGEQIYNICKILFKEKAIQSKLNKYETVIALNKNKEEEKNIKQKIELLEADQHIYKGKVKRVVSLCITFIMLATFLLSFYMMINRKVLSSYTEISVLLLILIAFFVMAVSLITVLLLDMLQDHKKRYREANMYDKQLETIMANRKVLEEKYHNLKISEEL